MFVVIFMVVLRVSECDLVGTVGAVAVFTFIIAAFIVPLKVFLSCFKA